jgi:sulfur carrier protein ThiS adenylyltransferase
MPEKYLIGASGIAGYGASNDIRTEKIGERLYMVGDFSNAAGPNHGLMAPRVGIAANCQANLAVSLLMETKS